MVITPSLRAAVLAVALAACGTVTNELPDAPPTGDDAASVDAGVPDADLADAAIDAVPDAPELPPDVTLTVIPAGTGTGVVASMPDGIVCGASCVGTYPAGTIVTLTADPAAGSTFSGWGGACSGTLDTCSITLTANTAVNAGFARIMHAVTVTPGGNGIGTVASTPAGISCPGTCTTMVAWGTQVTLAATPTAPSTFVGWSGACTGSAGCTFTVMGDVAIGAAFALDYTLVVQKQGTGAGTVTSTPAGISCGADCSETYAANTSVTLTATPAAGSLFAGWGGACSGTGACTVTLDTAKSVTATFNVPVYTLTVTVAGTGVGRVLSNPAGISCKSDCTENYNSGTSVTLTAGPAVGSSFTGWSGACTGTSTTCTVTMSQARATTATFAKIAPNIAFVTSTSHTGNLGGLAGADNICKARASAAGLAGSYRAWLSTSTVSAISRLGSARGWVRVDGKPLVDSQTDLTSGQLIHPLRIDETGADVGDARVMTATTADGTRSVNSDVCGNFTTTASAPAPTNFVTVGRADGLAAMFTTTGGTGCASASRLYCFGVDRAAVVDVTPATTYRRAFTTKYGFTPGGGLAAADAQCTQEATAAALPGTYRALLATSTASAGSRFSSTGAPWARLDGVVISTLVGFTFSVTRWIVTPNLTADRLTWHGNTGVWMGASSLSTAGTLASTCNNWTSASSAAAAKGGRAGLTTLADFADFSTDSPCNATYMRLVCLQQ